MKVGVIGAGTMGQGIAKAFAQVDGYEVALCDIKIRKLFGNNPLRRGRFLNFADKRKARLCQRGAKPKGERSTIRLAFRQCHGKGLPPKASG